MTTMASRLCLTQVSLTCWNCSSVLILVRSVPRKSKPPVLMIVSTSASVISNRLPLSRPFGPGFTPNRVLPAPSTRLMPQTTLWPPEAGPPEKRTATRLPWATLALAPAEERTTLPEACTEFGKLLATLSLSLVLSTRGLFAKLTACGWAAEPNSAQTGSGSWRTADSKIDWCDSSFFNCSAKVLMVRSLKEKEVLRYKAVVLRTGCIP